MENGLCPYSLFERVGNRKTVDLCDVIAQPTGNTGNICTGGDPSVYLLFQKVNLGFPNTILENPIEIMIGAVVVDSITAKIAQVVYIPCFRFCILIQAIPDIPAGNVHIPHAPPIPQAQIRNDKNGLR